MNIIFGPVNSRRFGKSLGVDLSPGKKQCNFDCLYCELKSAKVVNNQTEIIEVKEIVSQIEPALNEHKDIDVLTLTANGEPTLYPHLNELIDKINQIKGSVKTLILSNGSTIAKPKIQEALAKLDSVKLSLDCASNECFKKLDRADKSVDLNQIKKGMIAFKKRYRGDLIIEILFVKGINDSKKEIEHLNSFLKELKPARVDIGTIDRPPAFDVKPLSYSELYKISLLFDASLNVSIAAKNTKESAKFSYSKEQILETLKRRPLTKDDINALFDSNSLNNFKQLKTEGKICSKISGNIEFFTAKSD